MELTTNHIKFGVFLQDNPVDLLELIFLFFRFFSLEKVQLIELLFGHYEVFSGNDSEVLFILALLYRQDLIWLSLSAVH